MTDHGETVDGVPVRRIKEYIEHNPEETTAAVLGRFVLDPEMYDIVDAMTVGAGNEDEDGDVDTTPKEPTPGEEDGLTSDAIREHYQRSRSVYETLADMAGNPTIAKYGDYGLYTIRQNDDPETVEEWPRVGRPMTFGRDFAELVDGAALGGSDAAGDGRDRTLYAHTSYNEPRHVEQWYRNRDAESKADKWDLEGENPMPGLRATRAIAAWGDIDLADGVKPRRPELTDDEQATVEAAIEAYIDEYAELYGSRDAVYALDSVGGLYIMGAPEATLPAISVLRDDLDGRERFISEFIDRSNAYLRDAEQRVNDRVDDAAELLDPDWVNNKNRPYKAPLSIHAKHDAVVTPIDTDAPQYEYTPVGDVDDELINDATAWARDFTADEHATCVDSLIEALWPEEYAEAGSWTAAIRLWLSEQREAEQRKREQRLNAAQKEADRIETNDIPEGARAITTTVEDVFDAVDQIDISELVRRYCAEWEPSGRSNHFNPGTSLWRESNSGEGCFVNPSKNMFVDVGKDGGKGGPAKFIALQRGIINEPYNELGGERYWQAIDALRSEGYEIPEFIPEAGSTSPEGEVYTETPYSALKRAAVATGVIPPSAFIERESDDGSTYEGFPGKESYNRTLAELEDRGIDHGREYAGGDADREHARNRITHAEVERRIGEQHGDDERAAGIARVLAEARLQDADVESE